MSEEIIECSHQKINIRLSMGDFHTDFAMFLSNCTKLRQGTLLFNHELLLLEE